MYCTLNFKCVKDVQHTRFTKSVEDVLHTGFTKIVQDVLYTRLLKVYKMYCTLDLLKVYKMYYTLDLLKLYMMYFTLDLLKEKNCVKCVRLGFSKTFEDLHILEIFCVQYVLQTLQYSVYPTLIFICII